MIRNQSSLFPFSENIRPSGGLTNTTIYMMRHLQLPHWVYNSILHEDRWSHWRSHRIQAIDQNDPFANDQLKYVITARPWWDTLQKTSTKLAARYKNYQLIVNNGGRPENRQGPAPLASYPFSCSSSSFLLIVCPIFFVIDKSVFENVEKIFRNESNLPGRQLSFSLRFYVLVRSLARALFLAFSFERLSRV